MSILGICEDRLEHAENGPTQRLDSFTSHFQNTREQIEATGAVTSCSILLPHVHKSSKPSFWLDPGVPPSVSKSACTGASTNHPPTVYRTHLWPEVQGLSQAIEQCIEHTFGLTFKASHRYRTVYRTHLWQTYSPLYLAFLLLIYSLGNYVWSTHHTSAPGSLLRSRDTG